MKKVRTLNLDIPSYRRVEAKMNLYVEATGYEAARCIPAGGGTKRRMGEMVNYEV